MHETDRYYYYYYLIRCNEFEVSKATEIRLSKTTNPITSCAAMTSQ